MGLSELADSQRSGVIGYTTCYSERDLPVRIAAAFDEAYIRIASIGRATYGASMRSQLSQLWDDESGLVHSTESVLFGTLLLIGSIAGMVTVRDTIGTEFGDLATALMDIDHSYSYASIETDCGTVAGSSFADEFDFCAAGFSDDDPPGRLNPVVPGVVISGGEGS